MIDTPIPLKVAGEISHSIYRDITFTGVFEFPKKHFLFFDLYI